MAAPDEEDAPFFVEALFPFKGTDASSLSFLRGDVIHVLNRLPSGWWDGVLDDDRGWFPSNYVRIISEAEAEEIYSRRELEQQQQQQELRNQHDHQRQLAHAQTRAHEQPQQQRQQVHQNVGQYSQHSQNQFWDDRTRPTGEYWEPEVTENGQIYYVNSLTGQRSREIPVEEDGEPHNQREFTQTHGNNSHISTSQHATNGVPIGYGRERSGTTTSQASSSRIDPISATVQRIGSEMGSYTSNATGSNAQAFAPLHRSETPEPWQRRLTPDGQAYYYVNPTTEETRWTRPEPSHGYTDPLVQGASSDSYSYSTQFPPRNQNANYHARERTNSEASYSGRERDPRRTSVYSDTSEVSPLGPDPHHQFHHLKKDVRPWPTPGAQGSDAGKQGDETNPLQIAITLQGEMAPPALPPLTVYSERACEAIGAVVKAYGDPLNLANGSSPNAQRDGDVASEGGERVDHQVQGEVEERTSLDAQSIQAMADRVALVVIAVRNLLYVSGTLTGSLPNLGGSLSNPHGINPHGAGLNSVGAGLNEDVDWVRQEIKPFQRKVTATLSKLVLSARAVNSNPDWPRLAAGGGPSAAASRVENDASELERAVTTFVYQISRSAASSRAKRLYGALLPGEGSAGIGPGLIGAGIGGGWKGAGFVPMRDGIRDGILQNGPEIRLGREVVSELASLERLTGERINALRVSVESYKVAAPAALTQGRNYDPRAADLVILNGRLTAGAISDFLRHAEEVHIATGVDVMGTADDDDAYLASVKRARELIRMFETAKQALYDDGSVLLMASQAMHVSSLGTTASVTKASGPADVLLHTAIPALQANLGCIMEALELLLDIAREQDEAQAQRMPQIGPGGVPPPTDYPHDREYYRGMLRRQTEMMNPTDIYEPIDSYEPADNDELDLGHVLRPGNQRALPNFPYAPQGPDHRLSEVPSEATTLKPEPAPPSERTKAEDPGAESDDSQKKLKRKDLSKFIGENPQEAKPWYLQLDFTGPSNIVINPDGSVKAATLPALIERLTMHTSPDARLNNTFMMTFKSFATIDQVFDMLAERYNMQPPEGLTQAQLEEWVKEKKTPIKLRVINTMRKLIDVLEKEDLRILDRVKAFASDIVASEPERAGVAKTLLGIVQRVEKNGIESKRTMHTTTSDFPPPSILPRKVTKIKLLDIDPLELARQLTILESELFFKIKQSECIARAKDSTPAGPDNIKNVITLANQMAHWVADAVLSKEDPRRRAAVIKHFINVAEKCRGLSNFSSMAALLAGLNCPPIRRLKRTWEQVNPRITSVLDDLEATLDTAHNFQGYKAIISRRQPPCVPFLGVYLTVLTFIQDGARDTLSEGGLINFQKRQKTADVIQEITKFQMLPYNLTKLSQIRQFIDESLAALPEDPDFWQLSLDREPREREDEKMARLLQESGFL